MSASGAEPRQEPQPVDAGGALAAAFRVSGRAMSDDAALSAYEACLSPMLRALGWTGEERHVVEALPHFDKVETLDMFRVVLGRLGFTTKIQQGRLQDLSADAFPLLYVDEAGPVVALGREPGGALRVAAAEREGRDAPPTIAAAPAGRVVVCRVDRAERTEASERESGGFWGAITRFKREIRLTLALTLAANVLALSTPLFSMAVYNNVLLAKEPATLWAAAAIVLFAIAAELRIRQLRTEVISTTAARLSATVVRDGLERILTLPSAMTENATVGMQTARLKQFENVLNAFTGPLANALLDLPFTLVFVAAVAIIGGPLAAVPLALALVFTVLGATLLPSGRRLTRAAGRGRLGAEDLVRQTLDSVDDIRAVGAEEIWTRRLQSAFAKSGEARLRSMSFEITMQSAAQFLTAVAGAAVLGIGALSVMAGELSAGGLIAIMMLVWRVLSPMQTLFLSLQQVVSTRDTIRQFDALMRLKSERDLLQTPTIFRRFQGALRLEQLTFRYPRGHEFALRGLNLDAAPGETIGVLGRSSAGKTTLFKLLLGLHQPTGGAIFFDGLNAAQLDLAELRTAIAFAPDRPSFFYGTVAQNIRMRDRTASDDEIADILARLGLLGEDGPLREGPDTRLTQSALRAMSDGERQLMSLARALATPARYVLLDEPLGVLDAEAKRAVGDVLEERRGDATTFIVSNEREILARADRVLLLERGAMVACDAPEKVLPGASALLQRPA